jgi:hypothetical protein
MTLRISGTSDTVLDAVVRELGVGPVPTRSVHRSHVNRALVPYDRNGKRLPKDSMQNRMWLDFSDRAKIKITDGHNIQGAKQPTYLHIGRKKPYKGRAPGLGHGIVIKRENTHWVLNIDGATMRLGVWWLESAQRGIIDALPVVNISPQFENGNCENSLKSKAKVAANHAIPRDRIKTSPSNEGKASSSSI